MREADRNKLWDRYHVAKTPELREQLILEYANVVNLVADVLVCIWDIRWNMMI